jgi:nicotinamide riboside transporter PnuC
LALLHNSPLLNNSLLLAGFFLPAAICLYFAWSTWIDEQGTEIAHWRRVAFQCGLVAAVFATMVFITSCWYMLQTVEATRGIVLAANWLSAAFWIAGTLLALAGKGWPRLTLAGWALLMVLGLAGIVSARIL